MQNNGHYAIQARKAHTQLPVC